MEEQRLPVRTPHMTEHIAGLALGAPGQRGDLNALFDRFHLGLLRALVRPVASCFACDPRWTHQGLLWAIQAHHDELDQDVTLIYRLALKHRLVPSAIDRREYAFSLQVKWAAVDPPTIWRFSSLIKAGYCARDHTVLRYDSLHPEESVFFDTPWPAWFDAIWMDIQAMQPSQLEIDLALGEMSSETLGELRALSERLKSNSESKPIGTFPSIAHLEAEDTDPLADLLAAREAARRRLEETHHALIVAFRAAVPHLQRLTIFDLKPLHEQTSLALSWAQEGFSYQAPSDDDVSQAIERLVDAARARFATYESDQRECTIQERVVQACCQRIGHRLVLSETGIARCQRCEYQAAWDESLLLESTGHNQLSNTLTSQRYTSPPTTQWIN